MSCSLKWPNPFSGGMRKLWQGPKSRIWLASILLTQPAKEKTTKRTQTINCKPWCVSRKCKNKNVIFSKLMFKLFNFLNIKMNELYSVWKKNCGRKTEFWFILKNDTCLHIKSVYMLIKWLKNNKKNYVECFIEQTKDQTNKGNSAGRTSENLIFKLHLLQ